MHLTGGVHNVGGGSTGHGKVYPFQFRAQKIPGGGGVCQSPLEERIFRALVRNRAVVSFEIRPLRIPYRLGQQVYYFTPTLLVHYAGGRKVLVEVKARQTASDPASQAKFHAAADYAAAHDMAFEVWAGPAPAPATGLNGATGLFSNEAVASLQGQATRQELQARAREAWLHRQERERRSLAFWSIMVFLVGPIVLGLWVYLTR